MDDKDATSKVPSRRILVAGDVCLDVVGVPIPPPALSPGSHNHNWRLAGETRTHFLPGGAMLLAKFIRAPRLKEPLEAADKEAQAEIRRDRLKGDDARQRRFEKRDRARRMHTKEVEDEVIGPRPKRPPALADPSGVALYQDDFIEIAERLKRDEIVHSLLAVKLYPKTARAGEKEMVLRVEKEHGYSGPLKDEVPSLEIEYPASKSPARIVVLDDTGNRFRLNKSENPWPEILHAGDKSALVVYKLHRPLPSTTSTNALWDTVKAKFSANRLAIISVDDLRLAEVPISYGLSWERTALDVVWQLRQCPAFKALRDCPRLVIRLGFDGAILWECRNESQDESDHQYRAWLIYDPDTIEGGAASNIPGGMACGGSAFTAALVHSLAAVADDAFAELLQPSHAAGQPTPLLKAIEAGLRASRRLLQLGFGDYRAQPNYPGPELFDRDETINFYSTEIPLIPDTAEPDRNYWRILTSTFKRPNDLRTVAVQLLATKQDKGILPKEVEALEALKKVPTANYGDLHTHDRAEIENYRALYTLLRDYLSAGKSTRPLSIGVFGPPGAGKSFGVKEVAKSLRGLTGAKESEPLTFNLSLYQTPDELSHAFHLVRDVSLRGKVPLVFFDEFDTPLQGKPLGWLRYFLSPMQDGEFLDRGAPHPIGPAVFIFAGGTSATYEDFYRQGAIDPAGFKMAKGPDFLSRLRATLDIPSLNMLVAHTPPGHGPQTQPIGTFNPFGPVSSFPCLTSILLRRATILAVNLPKKGPSLVRANGSLNVAAPVLRALLHLPQFEHGNRSFEALLDMSHLAGAEEFTPSLLPPLFQVSLHANPKHLQQIIGPGFPLPADAHLAFAQAIHAAYQKQKRNDRKCDPESIKDWAVLSDDYKDSNFQQAADYANKLRAVGLWIREYSATTSANTRDLVRQTGEALLRPHVEMLAKAEHDRWVAEKRLAGWAPARNNSADSRDNKRLLQNCLFPWDDLTDEQQELDREPVRQLPKLLADIGYEIVPE